MFLMKCAMNMLARFAQITARTVDMGSLTSFLRSTFAMPQSTMPCSVAPASSGMSLPPIEWRPSSFSRMLLHVPPMSFFRIVEPMPAPSRQS